MHRKQFLGMTNYFPCFNLLILSAAMYYLTELKTEILFLFTLKIVNCKRKGKQLKIQKYREQTNKDGNKSFNVWSYSWKEVEEVWMKICNVVKEREKVSEPLMERTACLTLLSQPSQSIFTFNSTVWFTDKHSMTTVKL